MEWTMVVQAAFFAGVAIEAALVASLLFRNPNPAANRLLCVHILSVATIQVVNYLDYSGNIERVPYLINLPLPAAWLSIWSLYQYVCALTQPSYRFGKRAWLHLIPTFLAAVWALWSTLQHVPGNPVLNEEFFQSRESRIVITLLLFAAYYVAAFRKLKRYRQLLPTYFSNFTRVRLTWLNFLFACSIAMWCVALTDLLLKYHVTLWHVMVPLISLEAFILAVFTLRQSPIFLESEEDIISPSGNGEKKKTREEYFTPEQLAAYSVRLRDYLSKEKPYLNPELRLSELAAALELKSYQLTEIINRGEKMNFYELVNSYRVEEFKRRAADPANAHLSLLGLAMDSGFNSKSVFNHTFRRMTGKTPSEFRYQNPSTSTH